MRLFVALSPSQTAVDELRVAIGPLRADAPHLRFTDPATWHVTVAYIGDVEPGAANELADQLGSAARCHAPPGLSLRGSGRFENRVLWAGVWGALDGLYGLAQSVRAAAGSIGLPVDERPYRPHLTLAFAEDPTIDLGPAVTVLGSFEGQPWTAGELHLYRSHLGAGRRGGSRYERIDGWPIGG